MRALVFTFASLLALTALSWMISEFALPWGEMLVALSIASVKATLVVVFFMHLREESASARLTLVSGVFFVCLMATFVAVEIATRGAETLLPQ